MDTDDAPTTIVFVPGLLGSRIHVRQHWRNPRVFGHILSEISGKFIPTRIFGGNFRALADALAKNEPPIESPSVLESCGVPILGDLFGSYPSYRNMVHTLRSSAEQMQYRYSDFPYNWTDSIWKNGERLAKKLQQDRYDNASDMTYIIVAHSMGVLISLAAIRAHDPATLPRIRGLIFFKGPLRGAIQAYRLLTAGHTNSGLDIFKKRRDLQRVAYLSDSIWQLLPRDPVFDVDGASISLVDEAVEEFWAGRILQSVKRLRIGTESEIRRRVTERLRDLRTLDARLFSGSGHIPPPMFYVITRYLEEDLTRTRIRIQGDKDVFDEQGQTHEGDGTVGFFQTMPSETWHFFQRAHQHEVELADDGLIRTDRHREYDDFLDWKKRLRARFEKG